VLIVVKRLIRQHRAGQPGARHRYAVYDTHHGGYAYCTYKHELKETNPYWWYCSLRHLLQFRGWTLVKPLGILLPEGV
jgi:hypothetical protein